MKRKKSKFKSKVVNDAQRQKQRASSYGYLNLPKDVSIFKAEPEGKVKLDIMPYLVNSKKHPDRNDENEIAIPGELWYKLPFKIHRNVGGDNDTVVCPTSFGKACPICEYRSKRFKEGAEKEETDAMKTSLRNLYAVIPLHNKEYDEKVHIWDISQYLFQNLLNEELEEDEDNAAFPDLEEGLTLRIRFDKKSIGKTSFAEASRIDFEERKEAYDEDILDDIPCLDEILNILSYKEVEMKFFELDEDDIENKEKDEDEVEEKPKRVKKKIKKEPEPEEEEKEPEEEPEKEEKPKRRKRPEKEEKNKCPFNHKYGVDTDKKDDCDNCDVWESCIDKKEENEE
jgi:hypothetical protein